MRTLDGWPLQGAQVDDKGINFGIYGKNKRSVKLYIYNNNLELSPSNIYELDPLKNKTNNIWHIYIEGMKEGTLYTWVLDDSPELLDPYSFAYTKKKQYVKSKNIAVKKSQKEIKRPNVHMKDSIIYECQIELFTKNNNSKVKYPGTYYGFMEKIPYLKNLGITTVEFLPVCEWDDYVSYKSVTGEELKNVWGYNPIGFFAITKKFSNEKLSTSFSEINQLKLLISELHKNGMEVIIDVVYNHTAEGDERGPIYNFKSMDNTGFYIMEHDKVRYKNYSGCGNTFNCNDPMGAEIVLESLKYWYTEIGVDGFRFDLASILGRDSSGQWMEKSILDTIMNDPILQNAKLISESWDIGGYFLGEMPYNWSEWNGKYRDSVRKFIKRDFDQIPELLKRIFGSPDLFKKNKRKPSNSINYITSHDGFTMMDLVSYNNKHNQNNGENNQDGTCDNNSFNWGTEGITQDPYLRNLRKKLLKNMFLILMISQGVPMIKMGDEMGQTQFGNNNPYCQDNSSTWINWSRGEMEFLDLQKFVANMISLRKKYSIFRKGEYLEINEDENDDGYSDVELHGVEVGNPDYGRHSLSIAFTLYDKEQDTKFYIALNSYHDMLNFKLPPLPQGKNWQFLVDTSRRDSDNFRTDGEIIINDYTLMSSSCLILISK
ncbi:glycogen debranching protein [Fusobacterium sp. PH5-44]|uniref:glycogen debranching protein n=1 Tax=unclassified Fusobacterium TaxID=2648384 RepID=UPI003D20AE5B